MATVPTCYVTHIQNSITLPDTYKFSTSLDACFLDKTYKSNMAFCEKMFKIFLDSAHEDIEVLEFHVRANNFMEVKSIAHRIKNNYTWVGLPQLSEKMHDIENLARGRKPGIAEKFQELNDDFKQALILVSSEYKSILKYLGK